MSHSSSPNNRNSIFGWVKNLKNKNLLSNDSLNEISDNDILSSSDYNGKSDVEQPPAPTHHQEFLRPLLHHKSRSTNNVNRVRSNSQSDTATSSSIRQNRDFFLSNNPLVDKDSKYFGITLDQAISQGCAKISIFTDEDSNQVLQYGRIPIVVAKCGIYLKTKGLNVEGIFRVSGSSKRLKDLQVVFNSPPDFGKKLSWDGYTVHDAASILRRYLNSLPEPLIPLELYEQFRDPLRNRVRIINYMKYKAMNPKKLIRNVEAAAAPPSTPIDLLKTGDEEKTPRTINSFPSPSLSPDIETDEINDDTINTKLVDDEVANVIQHQDDIDVDQENEEEDNEHEEDDDDDNDNDKTDEEGKPLPSHKIEPSSSADKAKEEELFKLKQAKKSKNYKKLTKDVHDAIDEYKLMLDKLPILSKQLLFYILDLLAMVQNHSTENLMSSRNLAAIFQPSILSHPNHDLNPTEYALSQFVVEFLIQYAYKLLPNHDNLIKSNSSANLKAKAKAEADAEKGHVQVQLPTKDGTDNLNPTANFKRQHSKSLSSANHDDLVGYQNKVKSSNLPVIDKDYDVTDDEEEKEESNGHAVTVPHPAIVVSTPSNPSVPQIK